MVQIEKGGIEVEWGEIHYLNLGGRYLICWPKREKWGHSLAIMTHGYTSHKESILSWGKRLAEGGIPTLLFDLPGHYLGGYFPVEDFLEFQNFSHHLFVEAFKLLRQKAITRWGLGEQEVDPYHLKLILGGHSLGALLAFKAMQIQEFKIYEKWGIGVGFGHSSFERHPLESPFYRETLLFRAQLVSKTLHPSLILPWIKAEKEELQLKGEQIYLLSGENDIIATPKMVHNLKDRLETMGNFVIVEAPHHLPHHNPEFAAPHLYHFLKKVAFC